MQQRPNLQYRTARTTPHVYYRRNNGTPLLRVEEEEDDNDSFASAPTTRTQSIFVPLLLCIESCLFFEVLMLWFNEYLVAAGFRLMIGIFVCVAYHFRYDTTVAATEQTLQTQDLAPLLPIVACQDIVVALLTRGLFNLYSWLLIYTPVALYCLYVYREHRYWLVVRRYFKQTKHYLLDSSDDDDGDGASGNKNRNIV